MPNSYRIKTDPGSSKDINIQIEQDFDFLEILSLKITQSEIYARLCADYGVVVGRVIANNGYGVPNAKLSIFIPLSEEDETNPIISVLYPYKTLSDKNEDGYRYNLLPYTASYSNHTPTGTFPDREDVLINKSLIEVYDKYYKFTVKTNESGDFMIFGVPVGSQVIVMDLDVSDMGPFSLSPQDLIRMGMATEEQLSGTKFKADNNLETLPQLINITKEIEVLPFWGDPDICQIAITRTDFDLVKEANLDIQPTAIFMGSIISTIDKYAIKRYISSRNFCKVKVRAGELCSLTTGPGEILAIRHTIDIDINGQPILESVELEQNNKVIDENGTWLLDLPMNLDYVYTDPFGNLVLSNDPDVGIPTKARYRFKIKWQQPDTLDDPVRRAYFLVPNIREYGWTNPNTDPFITNPLNIQVQNSYAFSLDWNDYVDATAAIACEDFFYEFDYNQVYTVAQLIDQYRGGVAPRKIMSIKHILDDTCESTNNTFPANDAQYRPDFIYVLFSILIRILTPVFIAILAIIHVLGFLLQLIAPILFIVTLVVGIIATVIIWILDKIRKLRCKVFFSGCDDDKDVPSLQDAVDRAKAVFDLPNKLKNLALPNLTFPDCEMCNCNVNSTDSPSGSQVIGDIADSYQTFNVSTLSDWNSSTFYDGLLPWLKTIEINWIPDPTILRPPGACLNDMYLPTDYNDPLKSVLAGRAINSNNSLTIRPTVDAFMPYYQDGSDSITNDMRRWFSTNLNVAERLNLFNTKSKYFDIGLPGSFVTGGLGPNQIRVSFNYTANTGVFHYDNITLLSCDPGSSGSFSAGTIVFFQNPNKSGDVNCFSASTNNQFGIPTITGSSVNIAPIITINVPYANPTNPNNTINVPYQVVSSTADTKLHVFPVDIEYFQVITAMTISEYSSMVNPATDQNSLWSRYLNNNMRIRIKHQWGIVRPGVWRNPYSNWDVCRYQLQPEFPDKPDYPPPLNGVYCSPQNTINGTPWELVNPLTASTQGYNQILVFLVRGVDPYSTRNENSYNLGRLFGYSYTSPLAPVVTGKYKLNIPIQRGLKNARHDILTTNTSIDGYSNSGIFYQNYNYQPSINDFSAFSTSLHIYYSALDTNQFFAITPNTQPGYDIGNVYPPAGANHIQYRLDGSNAYGDPTYGDIRIQGPRTFQKHTSNTNLSTYWGAANTTVNSVNVGPVRCFVDEIVWPQRNPAIVVPSNLSSVISDFGYYSQDFNIFTCDYTIHKIQYGYTGFLSYRRYSAPNCDPCGYPYITPIGLLQGSPTVTNNFSVEADGCFTPANNFTSQNMGYFNGESVEGGGLFGGKWYWNTLLRSSVDDVEGSGCGPVNLWRSLWGPFSSDFIYEYFAPTYNTASTLNIGANRFTVMRSDRLPTSTSVTRVQNNSFALHQNPSFLVLTSLDSGIQSAGVSDITGYNLPTYDEPTNSLSASTTGGVLESLNDCGKMVQLDCYSTNNNTISIPPSSLPGCNEWTLNGILGLGGGTFSTFDYGAGCYRLVQRFITGLPRDIVLLLEWKSRLDLTFGACRGVFGHMFTNNWVNGTLFAYAFKNDKFFDAQNNAVYNYCKDTLVFHNATNNYYYRSSPYNSIAGDFIGKNIEASVLTTQQYNLNNPTTILNLGPRADYLNQLVLTNQFDGYVVDKFKESTFSDTSDILNIFILSRLANSNLFSKLIGANGAGILGLFTRFPWSITNLQQQKNIIDADFAQLISITSELGVAPYEEDAGTPIFFQSTNSNGQDTVIGLFFDSETQIRDYVSPRRTIYVDTDPQPYPAFNFNYLPVKTQEVPFYGWTIQNTTPVGGSQPNIFGTQQNDWNSRAGSSPFPKYFYQQLDRLNQTQVSDYMAATINTESRYLKGHIYNIDAAGNVVPFINPPAGFPVIPAPVGNNTRITNGAPFHFYFGLIRGATAYNRFYTKWIKAETI